MTTETMPVSTSAGVLPQKPAGRLFSEGEGKVYGDFRDDLLRDGVAVVKGAAPRDRALGTADKMFKWLEDLYESFLPQTLWSKFARCFRQWY